MTFYLQVTSVFAGDETRTGCSVVERRLVRLDASCELKESCELDASCKGVLATDVLMIRLVRIFREC